MITSPSQLTERERDFIKAWSLDPDIPNTAKTIARRMKASHNHACQLAKRLFRAGILYRLRNNKFTNKNPNVSNKGYIYMLTQTGMNIYDQLYTEEK